MAIKYKVTRSFYSASQQHFNENELVDPSVYHNQTATDQGNFIMAQVSDQPPPPAQTLSAVKEAPAQAAAPAQTASSAAASKTASAVHQVLTEAHETFWQKVELQFDAWKRDMTSEWDKIKGAIVQFFEAKESTAGAVDQTGSAAGANAAAGEGMPVSQTEAGSEAVAGAQTGAETGAGTQAAPPGQAEAQAGQPAEQQPSETTAPPTETTSGSQTT